MLSDSEFVQWATAHASPIASDDSQDTSDLLSIRRLIGKARVVGFGESQHHVGEFARVRARVFRYLVEEMDFTTFVFECGVVESKPMHDYILGRHDDFEAALLPIESGFNAWRGFQDVLQWMREYNLGKASGKKLKFYGMDGSRRWMSTWIAVRFVCEYLEQVDPERAARVRLELFPLVQEISLENAGTASSEMIQNLVCGIVDLVGHLEMEQMRYVEQTGFDAFDWAHRASLIACQIGAILSATHARPQDAQRNRWGIRDAGMAEAIKWILEREGAEGKLLVHAANMHLQRVFASDMRATAGQHLSLKLSPEELVIIAGSNYFSLKPDDPAIDGSFQASLGKVGIPSFMLDLREAEADSGAGRWLDQERPDRSNIDFIPIRVARAWDAIYFTKRISLDTLRLPAALRRPRVKISEEKLNSVSGVYDIRGIGDSRVVLSIVREGSRLLTEGSESDGELFPMHVSELFALSEDEFEWQEWPHRVHVERGADGEVKRLYIQVPGAFDKFYGQKVK